MLTFDQWTKRVKPPLPPGKITAQVRPSRGVVQVYIAGKYITGASASFADEAFEELADMYEIPPGTQATIIGYKTPEKYIFK